MSAPPAEVTHLAPPPVPAAGAEPDCEAPAPDAAGAASPFSTSLEAATSATADAPVDASVDPHVVSLGDDAVAIAPGSVDATTQVSCCSHHTFCELLFPLCETCLFTLKQDSACTLYSRCMFVSYFNVITLAQPYPFLIFPSFYLSLASLSFCHTSLFSLTCAQPAGAEGAEPEPQGMQAWVDYDETQDYRDHSKWSLVKNKPFKSKLKWFAYKIADGADRAGEAVSDFFGITESRYQYVVDAHERKQWEQRQEQERLNQLAAESAAADAEGGALDNMEAGLGGSGDGKSEQQGARTMSMDAFMSSAPASPRNGSPTGPALELAVVTTKAGPGAPVASAPITASAAAATGAAAVSLASPSAPKRNAAGLAGVVATAMAAKAAGVTVGNADDAAANAEAKAAATAVAPTAAGAENEDEEDGDWVKAEAGTQAEGKDKPARDAAAPESAAAEAEATNEEAVEPAAAGKAVEETDVADVDLA